jgi:zinc protease
LAASVVKAEDMQYVKDEIVKALENAKTTPFDAKIISETKMHLRNRFAMGIDNPTSIAESLSAYTWLTGDPESINRTYANYEKVTAEDMMNAAKKYFIPSTMTIGTISPEETASVK